MSENTINAALRRLGFEKDDAIERQLAHVDNHSVRRDVYMRRHPQSIHASFAKTIVWIELVTIPLTWLFPDVRANRHMLGFSWAAVTGGIVFGIGAAVNRACSISILTRLGEGDLLTIAAMLFGAAIAADMASLSNSAIQQPLANLDEPSVAAACFLVLASAWAARDVWRLWRAWPEGVSLGQILFASPYRLSAAGPCSASATACFMRSTDLGPIRLRSSAR